MGANIRLRSISDYVHNKANLLVECRACPNKGVLDAAKLGRWFWCHQWNDAMEVVGMHLYCKICRGKPGFIRPTPQRPDRPDWMQYEHQWAALVKRLRNW